MFRIAAALLLVVLFSGMTCRKNTPGCHMMFHLHNFTTKAVYGTWSTDSTLLNLDYPPAEDPATNKCEANSAKQYGYGGCLEDEFANGNRFHVFIFDAQVLETNSWQSVKDNYMLLKRVSFTRAQMDSAGWIVDHR